ncbi:type II secretion system protein GspE [Salinicola corii]|uniref:Type II secretion system protein GspE n=1 Tax=Salinicola corii TaxID=2606937 RepID=A0A640WHP1_9GAMM|nr:ATPase, T2SS/T4P/T4SS family [Salinicola corii]KAA0019911.1 type II secretion system protein GspE [Salinicola corii]
MSEQAEEETQGENTSKPPLLSYRIAQRAGIAAVPTAQSYQLYCRHDGPQQQIAILQELQRVHGTAKGCEWLDETRFEARLGELYDTDRASTEALLEGLAEHVDLDSLMQELPRAEDLLDAENEAPVIRLINGVFSEALRLGASDIHVEPFEKELVIRLRVDGSLRTALKPPRVLAAMLISRIKVMAKLDIAEKRQPQDGRIAVRTAGRQVDIRVSTLPGIHGERVVMRLLDKHASLLDLERLGMPQEMLDRYRHTLRQPNGILLNTGPTGSGKTTTLYASLNLLNDSERNILTVEDPVEYAIPGIGQTPVNPHAGLTFARGLRAILRQDPDVIMIGEIRDLETAAIAVQSSLTGHLVLSTLHTNSALGAVARLRDMGIEPYLLATSLKGVMAQRLVRRLCPACRQWHATSDGGVPSLPGLPQLERVAIPVGCEQCDHTGYRGRLGLYEFIAIDDTLMSLIHDGASEAELSHHAFAHNLSLTQAAQQRLEAGETSYDEILRAIHIHT